MWQSLLRYNLDSLSFCSQKTVCCFPRNFPIITKYPGAQVTTYSWHTEKYVSDSREERGRWSTFWERKTSCPSILLLYLKQYLLICLLLSLLLLPFFSSPAILSPTQTSLSLSSLFKSSISWLSALEALEVLLTDCWWDTRMSSLHNPLSLREEKAMRNAMICVQQAYNIQCVTSHSLPLFSSLFLFVSLLQSVLLPFPLFFFSASFILWLFLRRQVMCVSSIPCTKNGIDGSIRWLKNHRWQEKKGEGKKSQRRTRGTDKRKKRRI